MTIVVGFLRSPEGRAALERAIEEAQLRDGRLFVVHSLKDDPEEVRTMREEVEKVRAHLRDTGVDHDVREFVRGNTPAEDVLQVAKDESAELIVIGLRRRSPVGKLVMGSNAQDILLQAECPVLAVKAGEE